MISNKKYLSYVTVELLILITISPFNRYNVEKKEYGKNSCVHNSKNEI